MVIIFRRQQTQSDGFCLLVLIQKEQVICCLLASYCSHSLYFVSVDHCCWNLRGAGTPADPDDSFFFWPSVPLSDGFSKFVEIASFWFSSVVVGFALFSPVRAKYEDIRFMTLTCHALCLNLPWQTNSQHDLDAWKWLYIKLSTDTDKDFLKTGRISGLISGIYYWDDLKR